MIVENGFCILNSERVFYLSSYIPWHIKLTVTKSVLTTVQTSLYQSEPQMFSGVNIDLVFLPPIYGLFLTWDNGIKPSLAIYKPRHRAIGKKHLVMPLGLTMLPSPTLLLSIVKIFLGSFNVLVGLMARRSSWRCSRIALNKPPLIEGNTNIIFYPIFLKLFLNYIP